MKAKALNSMLNHPICSHCLKTEPTCVCSEINKQTTRLHVVILQHPQEPGHEVGSGLLAHLILPNSTLKIGLSWRNLASVVGNKKVNSSEWGVLYLGSGIKGDYDKQKPIQFVSKKGLPVENPVTLKGLVVLDGTWSQAKSLWWRNPWLLKLKRAILNPTQVSLYKELRKEPRKECLSTIESIALALSALGEDAQISSHLNQVFSSSLKKERALRKQKL